jgi:hypothetical protein
MFLCVFSLDDVESLEPRNPEEEENPSAIKKEEKASTHSLTA